MDNVRLVQNLEKLQLIYAFMTKSVVLLKHVYIKLIQFDCYNEKSTLNGCILVPP